MRKTKPCTSFALGMGSVLSIMPTIPKVKLVGVSAFNISSPAQHIEQYWKNVGRNIKISMSKVDKTYE